MTVIYESAFTVMCDSPDNYRDQPGANFLKRIETSWDETRYLDGYPGEDIVLARRKGKCWYVGGMTNEEEREASFLVNFPEASTWKSSIWRDGSDTDSDPTQLIKETKIMNTGDSIHIDMAKGGGFVMILEADD